MTWGGCRQGAGRRPKALKRTGRTFRLTDEEYNAIRPLIIAIKERNDALWEQEARRCEAKELYVL